MATMWPMIAGIVLLLSLLVPPPTASSSPMVFEINGDVYPTGHFYVTMHIGDPPRPYYLDVDTGSMLTWVQTPPARAATRDLSIKLPGGRTTPAQCDYQIQYADGASVGVLLADTFSFQAAPSNAGRPTLAFGCGYDQGVGENFKVETPVDGVLGLGRGPMSLLSQLESANIVAKHVVGHCIGSGGRGLLFFGDDGEALLPHSGVTWVPMAKSGIHYSPDGSATLCFNGQPLGGVNPMQLIFDSGTTFNYFASQPYQATVTAVKSTLWSLTEVKDPALPLCWKGEKPFKTVHDIEEEFRPLSFRFANGNDIATMEIPPARYLIVTKDGNACLGILAIPEQLGESNLIGDITMQDQIVVYDNERGRIGWVDAACDSMLVLNL